MSKEQNQDLNLFGEVHPLLLTPAEGTEGQVPLRCPLPHSGGWGEGGTAGGSLCCRVLPYTPHVHGAQLAVVGAGHTPSWALSSSR